MSDCKCNFNEKVEKIKMLKVEMESKKDDIKNKYVALGLKIALCVLTGNKGDK